MKLLEMYKKPAFVATAKLLAKKGTGPLDAELNPPVQRSIAAVSERLRREIAKPYSISRPFLRHASRLAPSPLPTTANPRPHNTSVRATGRTCLAIRRVHNGRN